jgi:hypothetical protein
LPELIDGDYRGVGETGGAPGTVRRRAELASMQGCGQVDATDFQK